jgi:hypothetical protein
MTWWLTRGALAYKTRDLAQYLHELLNDHDEQRDLRYQLSRVVRLSLLFTSSLSDVSQRRRGGHERRLAREGAATAQRVRALASGSAIRPRLTSRDRGAAERSHKTVDPDAKVDSIDDVQKKDHVGGGQAD